MLFTWLKKRRRRALLASPFPDGWIELLQAIDYYRLLTNDERARLRDGTRIFVAEREFEGCGGLAMSDEIRVTIAASAALLVLGLDDFVFDNVPTIFVY